MLTRAVEQDELNAINDMNNDPNIRAIMAVPHVREEPNLQALIDAEEDIYNNVPIETNEPGHNNAPQEAIPHGLNAPEEASSQSPITGI